MDDLQKRYKKHSRGQWIYLLLLLGALLLTGYLLAKEGLGKLQTVKLDPLPTIEALAPLEPQPTAEPQITAEPTLAETMVSTPQQTAVGEEEPEPVAEEPTDLILPTISNLSIINQFADGVYTFVGTGTQNSEIQLTIQSDTVNIVESISIDENGDWVHRADLTEAGTYQIGVAIPNATVEKPATFTIFDNIQYAQEDNCWDNERTIKSGILIDETRYQTAPCETLYRIAQRLHVNESALKEANLQVNFDNLFAGTELEIPPVK